MRIVCEPTDTAIVHDLLERRGLRFKSAKRVRRIPSK